MRLGGHYRLTSGVRVRLVRTGVSGSGHRARARRDHVRVRYVGGPRDGQEATVASRDIARAWTADDDKAEGERAALNKKVGAARVRLAALGFDGMQMRVQGRGDGSLYLSFHGDAADQLLEILERASEEAMT